MNNYYKNFYKDYFLSFLSPGLKISNVKKKTNVLQTKKDA